jgi:two-component system LytT family response regulator
METIRTLIVDDEPLAREGIRVLLGADSCFEVVGECGSGSAAVKAVREQTPDLMFLDVQMPQMDGFEVLSQLDSERLPVVIFVTAYDRYALRAFEHHALDYLLKPFDDERFQQTLERAKTQIRQREAHRLSRRMLAVVAEYREIRQNSVASRLASSEYLSRLAIKTAGRVFFLKVDEIDWIEAADYYVKLHVGGKSHLLRESMSRLERRLDPECFMRIHRSTIVNLERIKELRSQPAGEFRVCLDDGTQLRLSRGRKDKLGQVLGRSGLVKIPRGSDV